MLAELRRGTEYLVLERQEKVLRALLGWMLDRSGWREEFMWSSVGG
ncbi:hypothetical protein [Streptomyces sp. LaBMicrA B280]